MTLFNLGNFQLNSGKMSKFKIDCDVLIAEDIEVLATLIAEQIGSFGEVEGVPTGGLRLAEALQKFATSGGGLLIVDDVLTTGGSMERQRAGRDARGAVIFARGLVPDWIYPVFTCGVWRSVSNSRL